MIIKKYIVDKMSDAMIIIKKDLGEEAIIISQRKVRRRGVRGYFRPKVIEVTAAIDKLSDSKVEGQNIENLKRLIGKQREIVKENLIVPKNLIEPGNDDKLHQDVQNIKDMMSDLRNDMGTIAAKGNRKSKLETQLIKNDVNENVVGNILKRVRCIDKSINESERATIAIKDMVSISHTKNDKIIVMVGPTGVGKTTTIAKLAGKYSLIDKKKVGLITIDTYRIGAVEQLRTYADIMNIPMKVVFSINDMEAAVKGMQSCDVILVDTTGRSSKNVMQISELRAFIDKLKISNVNLVISCTTKNNDIDTYYKRLHTTKF